MELERLEEELIGLRGGRVIEMVQANEGKCAGPLEGLTRYGNVAENSRRNALPSRGEPMKLQVWDCASAPEQVGVVGVGGYGRRWVLRVGGGRVVDIREVLEARSTEARRLVAVGGAHGGPFVEDCVANCVERFREIPSVEYVVAAGHENVMPLDRAGVAANASEEQQYP